MKNYNSTFLQAILLLLVAVGLILPSCRYDKIEVPVEGFPEEVGKIFSGRCALSGCHTANDKDGAGGLDLSSWDALFNGTRNGSAVIPFSSKYSFLNYFINSYPDLGIIHDSIGNVMPPSPPVLTHDAVSTIVNWINDGARSSFGSLKFPDDAGRRKIYVAMQNSDEVAVFDAASRQIMRYVKVGADDLVNEQPHQVRISPDGQYWYVVFLTGTVIQRYNTLTDEFAGQATIGNGNWNTMSISPDGNHAFVADFSTSGKVVHVNLQTMTHTSSSIPLEYPHGTYFMQTQNVLYITLQYGNFIYKVDFNGDPNYLFNNITPVMLQTGAPPTLVSTIDAHEIIFTPDESKYFVTCQKTNGIRIFQASNDLLLDSVPVGSFPQEMAISASRHLLFVTCQEDSISSTLQTTGIPPFIKKEKGSVYVYDYQAGHLVSINPTPGFIRVYQPHGIAVDDASGKVYVGSLNISTTGVASHHSTGSGDNNGFISIIDLNTMEYLKFTDSFGNPYLYKCEVLPRPYSMMAK